MPILLNDAHRHLFEERGVVRLERLVPRAKLNAAKDAVLAELTRLGARAGGKWHVARMPVQLRHSPPFDDVVPSELLPLLNTLARRPLSPAHPHPQILLTPPQQAAWSLPPHGWHLDVKSPSRDEVPGIQVFVLLDDVVPQGGGTLAIAGSHKLHAPRGGVAVSAHHALKDDPVYATLFSTDRGDRSAFMQPLQVRGVTVQVVEMCGDAGDAYLMDMRVVHAAAPNATRRMRMMLTQRHLP